MSLLQLAMPALIGIRHFEEKAMQITSEDIRAIQRKLDSLRKMRHLAESKVKSKTSKKQSSKLEDDVFDSEKFFDED